MKESTKEKWAGRWEQLCGNARKLWGNLTNDDVQKAKGDYERLVGTIKERTGLEREAIEKQLNA